MPDQSLNALDRLALPNMALGHMAPERRRCDRFDLIAAEKKLLKGMLKAELEARR